jgi:tetrahydromethanopterin S-methyltransferase subunit G
MQSSDRSERHLSTAAAVAKVDISQIINDLQPNMPTLLDSSLNASKVFAQFKNSMASRQEFDELKEKVEGLTPEGKQTRAQSKDTEMSQLKNDVIRLSKKLDDIDKKTAAAAGFNISDKTKDANEMTQLKRDITLLAKRIDDMEKKSNKPVADVAVKQPVIDVDRINKRLSDLESKKYSAAADSLQSSSDMLKKISIGLSMVAALFVAR